eukprot:TRINITY_DN13134_c0_g1_i2.p1 TRINITY_DN13134_c0_g1~~TRINITY_DN13134_c0_g1_i2.p1  ORF type:complete len:105 (+),score=6.57 TRINITY_DN13134_c0_g1_i2:875-1189(+)
MTRLSSLPRPGHRATATPTATATATTTATTLSRSYDRSYGILSVRNLSVSSPSNLFGAIVTTQIIFSEIVRRRRTGIPLITREDPTRFLHEKINKNLSNLFSKK